jgi:hypothetical protein
MTENLVAAIAGGLIAMCAGIAAPIVQHFLTDRTRKEAERRASVHALIMAVHELDHWLDRYREDRAFGVDHDLGVANGGGRGAG